MTTKIDIQRLPDELSNILDQVQQGEDFLLIRDGQAIALISAIDSSEPRKPGLLKGELGDAFFEPLPEDELKGWES
jgi:antitoxin (DNA-binding transcriptional repressor) of toxin-antitoxin stability system